MTYFFVNPVSPATFLTNCWVEFSSQCADGVPEEGGGALAVPVGHAAEDVEVPDLMRGAHHVHGAAPARNLGEAAEVEGEPDDEAPVGNAQAPQFPL